MALSLKKHEMPVQDPKVRAHNFDEVALGYDEETAVAEAERCLHCKVPQCRKGCPVSVDIPEFIGKIKERDFDGAIAKIKESNALPAVCGRVCPQENQCEKYCVLAKKGESVGIGRLERFVADRQLAKNEEVKPIEYADDAQKVAVIGSGPSGLSCAGDLAKKGYKVTVFEALHKAGGVLSYGIPEFRLPKDGVVKKEIANLEKLGVKFELNSVAGRLFTVDELMEEEGFSAVFIGTGAGLPRFQGIPGESLSGVYSANEFLTRCNLMKAYKFPEYATPIKIGKHVAVIGGGNVAMDAARTALRLGAEKVYIVYRRSEAELPARKEEVEHAKEEGIEFKLLNNPVEILGDENGWVSSMRCIKMELGEPDESGRRRPVAIAGSEFDLEVETVIVSIGTGPNPIISQTTPGLDITKRGNIAADEETGATSKPGVFAGGDIVTGAATVILAMGAGRKAAAAIDEYLQGKRK
ncbi:putative glutamate synthase (NADPH), homotetrameric [Selenomonas ruminantium subsp. lactilytica TAM6421]|uniref:Putative glutamate synthase (NADPH), homotetrameric n=1 Tax=Selenomonas ruminantium subsp. lactilytica (strain NBRC 103574 / TAM6421) TaxID=927704 RepID=I0GSX9_SELRL|nr:NADPH-dependent glutamate synthase [Selenomonas ruminantium]BAL83866.1 putative glutamate synthase (NADPH), homotetrameric [Selenomonas ruminantium subsp. lactilytica TAM6421]